jgi:hypothetical protein
VPSLFAGVAGGLACLILAALSRHPERAVARAFCVAAAGTFVLGLLAFGASGCGAGPFAGIDPLVREIWLDNVHEAFSFLRFARVETRPALVMGGPIALGFLAMLTAIRLEQGECRMRWGLVAALTAVGAAMAFWQIRYLASTAPLAALGGVWCALRLRARLEEAGMRTAAFLSFAAILPFSAVGWAIALGEDEGKQAAAELEKAHAACLAPAAFKPFLTIPSGLLLAPIDTGGYFIAQTPMSVLAGAYHRNNRGNRAALDAFLATPEAARALLQANRVAYVAICPGLSETKTLVQRAPQSLAAALLAETPPAWLERVALTGTPYSVYATRP